jgi:uncharacterized protein YehS (DUF1456 family)
MTNNDILRRLRFILDLNDPKVVSLFELADHNVNRVQVANWLKPDDDPAFVEISDKELAIFLNGVIIEKRGKRDGPTPPPEDPLSNNMIFKKLKIALNLKTEDIIELFALIDKQITKNELGAFFRNPDHKSYRHCMDQYLRNFLTALQKKHRKA